MPDTPKRNPIKRLGCALLLVAWFALLMMPCGLFYLAANGEIRLEHGDIPNPHSHPLLLVSLISERDERGLRIESSFVAATEPQLCIETSARFLLWHSSGGNQDVVFCDCYAGGADNWTLADTSAGSCMAGAR